MRAGTSQACSVCRYWTHDCATGQFLLHVLNAARPRVAGVCPLQWAQFSSRAAPGAIVGMEGIYNITQWDTYQKGFFNDQFHCPDWFAFGQGPSLAWDAASPAGIAALAAAPPMPFLLIHSPQVRPYPRQRGGPSHPLPHHHRHSSTRPLPAARCPSPRPWLGPACRTPGCPGRATGSCSRRCPRRPAPHPPPAPPRSRTRSTRPAAARSVNTRCVR